MGKSTERFERASWRIGEENLSATKNIVGFTIIRLFPFQIAVDSRKQIVFPVIFMYFRSPYSPLQGIIVRD